MKDTIKLYSQKHKEAKNLISEIANLELEKKRHQVSDKWDSL